MIASPPGFHGKPLHLVGPMLFFRGLSQDRWRLAAIIVLPSEQTPPSLTIEGGIEAAPERLGGRLDRTVWRYTFSVPMDGRKDGIGYAIGRQSWQIHPPGTNRLRIAYTACNGSEDERPDRCVGNRNALWRDLALEHAGSPFHLLIQGGDQLYADTLWQAVPALTDWWKLPWRSRLKAEITPQVESAVRDFYFDRYCWLWSQPEIAPVQALIPSLAMWDDHDIFDGWGSHPAELQQSPVFQGIWRAAREQFALFQLGLAVNEPLPEEFGDPYGSHFGWAYRIGDVAIIAPDLRSERTRRQVMGTAGWRWLIRVLAELGRCREVLLVSTVPVVNIDLSLVERLLRWLPGHAFYKDDLRDQWRSYAHRQEWRRLVRLLLDVSERHATPITVLSGEIHLGALGRIKRNGTRLLQLTSSGIVHPPPMKPVVWAFELFSRGTVSVDAVTRLNMLPLPGLGKRYLAARNWLSLDCNPDGSMRVRWHVEGKSGDFSMTIE